MTNSGPPFGPSPRPEANTVFLPPGLNFKISPAGRSPGISATYRLPAESNAIPRGDVKLLANVLWEPFGVNMTIAFPDKLLPFESVVET